MPKTKPLTLVILDGWGMAPAWGGNAITLAKPKNMATYLTQYPSTSIRASGDAVGLPGQARGNSEAGHLNMGAGRIIHQDFPRISAMIAEKTFYSNPAMLKVISHVKKHTSHLHIMGLLSDGGVHSHIDHLFAILQLCRKQQLNEVYLDIFTDGRDSEPGTALKFLERLEREIKRLDLKGKICTVSGRSYAMDRDNRWERTQKAYDAIGRGQGETALSAKEAIEKAYDAKKTDEYIPPTVIIQNNKPVAPIKDHDGIIFFNFRADRARQLASAFVEPNFRNFNRGQMVADLVFVTMTLYEENLAVSPAFLPEKAEQPLAWVFAEKDLGQFHIAETEKYAHVTYFFNGGRENAFPKEERLLIPSPKVETYDLKPAMSALQVADELIKRIQTKRYQFLLVNFANPDMVGHTGNLDAAIKAIQAVDDCLGRVVKTTLAQDGITVITADHGNAEQMLNPNTGGPDTEHTTNPVPFVIIGPEFKNIKLRTDGILADVAPTILHLLDIQPAPQMTGQNLIIK